MHKTPVKSASLFVLPTFLMGEDIENGLTSPQKVVLRKKSVHENALQNQQQPRMFKPVVYIFCQHLHFPNSASLVLSYTYLMRTIMGHQNIIGMV